MPIEVHAAVVNAAVVTTIASFPFTAPEGIATGDFADGNLMITSTSNAHHHKSV